MDIINISNNETLLQKTEELANIIWNEHYSTILSKHQIDYMLQKYQCKKAMEYQIKNEKYQYFALVENMNEIGYFAVKFDFDDIFLSKLYLLKESRGKGYSKEIIDYIEKNSQGKKSIYLTVNKNNPSISIYKKLGFEIEKECVTDIGCGYVMDDYIMRKMI